MDTSVITLSDTDLDSDPDLISDKDNESDSSIECIDITSPCKSKKSHIQFKTPEKTEKLKPFYIDETPSPLTPLETKPKENQEPPAIDYSSDEEPISLKLKRSDHNLVTNFSASEEEELNISDFLKSKSNSQNSKKQEITTKGSKHKTKSTESFPLINTEPIKRKNNENIIKTKSKGNTKSKVKKPIFHYSELAYRICPDYSIYSSIQLKELAKEYGMKTSLSDSVYVTKFTEIWNFLNNKQNK